MSTVEKFAAFLNKFEVVESRRGWAGVCVDAVDNLFYKGAPYGHMKKNDLVLASTLGAEDTSRLLRLWGGFQVLTGIANGRIIPCGDGALFEWSDPKPVGVAPSDPLPVANPDGIRPETKTEEFVRRLNDGSRSLQSGPFSAKPWCDRYNIYSGSKRIVGNIKADRLMIAPDVGPGAAEWLRETWRSLDAPPEIPLLVQRFLDALAEYKFCFKDDFDYTVEAPFAVTTPRSSGILITLGNGVEFGEINGDHFVADASMEPTMRATLEHIWRETIRVEAMIYKIAALSEEFAAKIARLDQIDTPKANP